MKLEEKSPNNSLQELTVRALKLRTPDDPIEEAKCVKEAFFAGTQLLYAKKFAKGAKLSDVPLVPTIFVIGTTENIYLVMDLERTYPGSKEKGVKALRMLIREFALRNEIPTFFFHFVEVRSYETKGPDDPMQQYLEKTGEMFPGMPMTSNYLITHETPTSYAMDIYSINESTGDLTLLEDKGTAVDITTLKGEEAAGYGGIFTHFLYKPEDAVELDINMELISMSEKRRTPKDPLK